MRYSNLLIFSFLLSIALSSCSDKSAHFSLTIANKDKSLTIGEPLKATISNKKDKPIDSIVFYIDNNKFKTLKTNATLSELPPQVQLGDHTLKAQVYFEDTFENLEQSFKIFNNIKPKSYTYKIVNTYPHDANAFTQGLEFYNGYLYESTGRKGESGIRKVDVETGKVLQQQDLDAQYFGEGITILNNKIYQLTWQGNKGFIYDLNSFKSIKTFSYNNSKEGWGLCNNGTTLFKSDGTSKIWKLNPNTLAETGYIQATSNKTISKKLNELEWVEGKIYANNWQIDLISIINPKTGAIEGLVDMRDLRKQVTTSDTDDNVLNGIAYDTENDRLFVTGKKWNKLFEIKIIEK